MDRLRSTLYESRALEARQRADSLLKSGTPLQHVLSTLHAAAACVRDPARGGAGAAHGLTFVYAVDRSIDDLERLGLLRPALHAAIDFLAGLRLEPVEPAGDGAGDVASLPQAWEEGDVARLAGALRGLENPRTERAARTALLDVTRRAAGPFGHRLVDTAAFLRGFERSTAHDRAVLAHGYARELCAGGPVRPAAPDDSGGAGDAGARGGDDAAESGDDAVADAEDAGATGARRPALPGTPSAGQLLSHLRAFHHPAAVASLDALIAAGRDEEALTVLVHRAEENAGPRWHHLLLADAVHTTFPLLGDARHELLRTLTRRLLLAEPDTRLVERLVDGVGDEPLRARERRSRDERLGDAIPRRDRETALEAAGALLADEEGADRVRRAVLETALGLEDAHAPRAFAAVAALVATARSVGWPAARGSLLRAVDLLAADREP